MLRFTIRLLLVILIILLVAGCGDTNGEKNKNGDVVQGQPITGFSIDVPDASFEDGIISLMPDQQVNVSVNLLPTGVAADVFWSSSSPAVTVTPSGHSVIVSAILPGGEATITISIINNYMEEALTSKFIVRVMAIHIPNYICYSEFGAVGDGITDDFDAILAAHEEANRLGVKVRAQAGKTYYIGWEEGRGSRRIRIQTDTDWTGANFIINDTNVPRARETGQSFSGGWIFEVTSTLEPIDLRSYFQPFGRGTTNLNVTLPSDSMVIALDDQTMRWLRRGSTCCCRLGAPQSDIFIVDKNGNIDPKTPIIWDFNNVSTFKAIPLNEKTLTITGGTFTIWPNQRDNHGGSFMGRGIHVLRSNTVIDGITHQVDRDRFTAAGGSPYGGFIRIENSANVTIKNAKLSAYKHNDIGTYGIAALRALNLTIRDSVQINDPKKTRIEVIRDTFYWGIWYSSFSKNILFDNVTFNRFDAHRGVHNLTVLNSTLGHQFIRLVGSGTLYVNNTHVHTSPVISGFGNHFLQFREDYGSTWEGNVIIRNSTWFVDPSNVNPTIIHSRNQADFSFGFQTYLPENIVLQNFRVEDTLGHPGNIIAMWIIPLNTTPPNPLPGSIIINPKKLYVTGFSSASGRPLVPGGNGVPLITPGLPAWPLVPGF